MGIRLEYQLKRLGWKPLVWQLLKSTIYKETVSTVCIVFRSRFTKNKSTLNNINLNSMAIYIHRVRFQELETIENFLKFSKQIK